MIKTRQARDDLKWDTLKNYMTRAAASSAKLIRTFLNMATFEKKNGDKADRQYVSRQTSH